MTEDQFNKLPTYARHEITRLRANVEAHERERRAMEPDGDSPWTLETGLRQDAIKLPPNAQVRYRLNEHDWVELHARGEGGSVRLELYANDTLVLMPNNSNVVRVEVRR